MNVDMIDVAVSLFIQRHPELLTPRVSEILREGLQEYLFTNGKEAKRRTAVLLQLLEDLKAEIPTFGIPQRFCRYENLIVVFLETLTYSVPRFCYIRTYGMQAGDIVRIRRGCQKGRILKILPSGRLFVAGEKVAFACDPQACDLVSSQGPV